MENNRKDFSSILTYYNDITLVTLSLKKKKNWEEKSLHKHIYFNAKMFLIKTEILNFKQKDRQKHVFPFDKINIEIGRYY